MKPLSLTISAFGPYRSTQRVDFAQFHEDGLFLIHGRTGAGKSTIFEAMCFALYGKPPGARGRGTVRFDERVPYELRSAGVDDAVVSKVEFEVLIGNRHYRFTRFPSYRKSSGAVSIAKATLEECVNGTWQPRESRISEVGTFVAEYVGLNLEQFSQLILLPQGDFANFLRSRSEDREKILETLFPLTDYKNIRDWFKNERNTANTRREDSERAQESAWVEVRTIAKSDVQQPEDASSWYEQQLKRLTDAATTARDQLNQENQELARLDKLIADAKSGNEQLAQYRQAVEALEQAQVSQQALAEQVADDSVAVPYSHSLPKVIESLRSASKKISEHLRQSQELGDAEESLAAARRSEESQQSEFVEAQERATNAHAAIYAARADLEELESADADQQRAQSALEVLRNHDKLLEQRDHALAAASRAEQACQSADAKWQEAARALQEERDQHVRSTASELSSMLVAGQPCMVCGSSEHPAPAMGPGSAADAATLKVREDELAHALDELNDARLSLNKAQTTLNDLADRVAKSPFAPSRELLSDDLRSAENVLEAAQVKVKRRDGLKKVLEEAAKSEKSVLEELERKRAAAEGKSKQVAEISGKVKALKAALPEDFDVDAAQVTMSQLDKRATLLDQVLTKAQQIERGINEAIGARDAYAAAAHNEEVDLTPLEQARIATDNARTEALRKVGNFESIVDRLGPAFEKFQTAAQALEQATLDADRWEGITPYFEGNKGLKIPLTRFYLAQRLKQVAEAASARLLQMTGGRYELVHDENVSARHGASGGLAILVRDNENARNRGPETLSGGETFMASLALALGLSDIVTAEAGGIRLDSLFIDEGFGTLDSETLEDVLDVLEGLREHNRLVGVVSHVDYLKDRIPNQVQVHLGENGSTIRQTSA